MESRIAGPEESELFSDAAREWLDWKKASVKDSSIERYSYILSLYLLPFFEGETVAAVTRSRAAELVRRLLTEGGPRGPLAPGSAAMALSVLKNILRFLGQIKSYSVPDLNGVSVRQLNKPLRVFSLSEQQRLCHYLLLRRDPVGLGIILALYTGLRVGELCALRWEDISLEENRLVVRHTMQRLSSAEGTRKTAVVISSPKSLSSLRTIPLPAALHEPLRAARAPGPCYVLTGSEDYIEPRTLENRFKAALRVCGIAPAGFHTCRHSFATRCVELGFDVKSLSEILGHASVNITMNRYVHPSMEFKQENMNRLGLLMNGEDTTLL